MIMELQKYMDVTVYGKCGHPCPKSADGKRIDCRAYLAEHYYFLLTFENSYCEDYISKHFDRVRAIVDDDEVLIRAYRNRHDYFF